MSNFKIKCALRENKHGFRFKYYFGEPPPSGIYIEHWKYAIPGEISFKGATLIFKAEDFTPDQPLENVLLEPYILSPNSRCILLLKLNLKKAKKIRKMIGSHTSYNAIAIHFELHGSFLGDPIKGLNLRIMANTKEGLSDIYEEIIKAKRSKDSAPESGSLKFN
jgi:hypothetical protein